MAFMRSIVAALLVAVAVMTAPSAQAVQPDEVLSDASLEARARHLSLGLRCLVCQNQSIDDSDAPLARDLRVLVRERLVAGDSDKQVIDYVVARYGDFVLLKPPLKPSTYLLWLAPLLLLGGGILLARRAFAPPNATEQAGEAMRGAPLSTDEQAKLDALLEQERNLEDDAKRG